MQLRSYVIPAKAGIHCKTGTVGWIEVIRSNLDLTYLTPATAGFNNPDFFDLVIL